ncbi:hypothetical protein BDQ12DRAFT_271601 [Crucibulum laeve]|uniref:Uncharacterized protein n=1 Tax=Crucibulum laeve TaxID=68775 RepID=A0A5C3MEQ2_9AGAR|nr:hypothetical protein BDQ12DRAFT_271601 [Crucibulum laeve]
MSVAITIHPLLEDLDMYGQPDSTSAYSLSGHVSIAVSSPYSLWERRRTARLLLQSLSLTFEGQSETYTPRTGYSGMRLCNITRDLVTYGPLELTNEGHEEDSEPTVWNVVFNLPIPGWLPESTTIGIEEVGIRYGLYATAKYSNFEEEQSSSSWNFASFCSPFRSRVKSAESRKTISLRRFVAPPSVDKPVPPMINFLVNCHASSSKSEGNKVIPPEVLTKIQVLASVPEYVNLEDESVPLTLRMRTKDMDEEHCKRIQISEIKVDITQKEKCRHRPSQSHLTRYPIPSQDMQPPNLPLRNPHPVSTVYDVGLFVPSQMSEAACRSFSLLPASEDGVYKLSDNNYVFADATRGEANPTWYTMETTIPFVKRSMRSAKDDSAEWDGAQTLFPSSSSPLYSVHHDACISLTCIYDLPDSEEKATHRLNFSVPIVFAKSAPALPPPRTPTPPPTTTSTAPALPLVVPYAPSLPAYSQLYDSNGDRKIDYSVPLPVYTPRSSAGNATTSSADSSSDALVVSTSASDLDIREGATDEMSMPTYGFTGIHDTQEKHGATLIAIPTSQS